MIPADLNSMPCLNKSEVSFANLRAFQTDHLVDRAAGSLRTTLVSITPPKKKIITQRKSTPVTTKQTHKLKRKTPEPEQKMEFHQTGVSFTLVR